MHLQPVGAERRDVLEQDDPLGSCLARALQPLGGQRLALLARELAMAMAERGVAHGAEVHDREHRRCGARDDLAHDVATLVPGRDEVVLGAHVAQLLGHRADDADVLLVELGVDHHGGIDPRLGAPPVVDCGIAVQHEHALRRSRC